MGDNEMWMWAFIPAGVGCLIAAGLALLLKTPTKPGEEVPEASTEEPVAE